MPNSGIENPHFKVPFSFQDGSAICVEQDSDDDVSQCVSAIVRTRKGFRMEIPSFGIDDPTLEENGPDLLAIHAAIDEWEPRAAYTLSERQLEGILSETLQINVGVKSDG